MIRSTTIFTILLTLLTGCASSSIPMTSRLSDAMLMSIKPIPAKNVVLEFQSSVTDGTIVPIDRASGQPQTMHPGFLHTESSTLEKMVREYVGMKFQNENTEEKSTLKVQLTDFRIEQFNIESKGKQLLVALAGGEMNIIITAYLDLVYEYTTGGQTIRKPLKISADSVFVQGIGTGTSTSRYDRGTDSLEHHTADAINGVNTKAIALLNQLIESRP